MTIYSEIAHVIEELLYDISKKELFNVRYISNEEQFNPEDLINEEKSDVVISVANETLLPENSDESKISTIQLDAYIQLGSELHDPSVSALNGLKVRLNNKKVSLETQEVTIRNVNQTYDKKYPGVINGNDYHVIQLTFEVCIFPHYTFNNEAVFTIDGKPMTGLINAQITSSKQMDGKVFSDGFVRPQNNGVQYGLQVDFLFDNNNEAHKKILADYKLQNKYNISYQIEALNFVENNCVLSSYTKPGVAGDTLKLSVTFMRGE